MERYENLGLVGEGSYGMVIKCRHKETNRIVAIKKFIESEDDKTVKKIALREITMLKQLHHDNLVNLLEVFRRKKRLFLVFEFLERTVLDDLEKYNNGLEVIQVKRISLQVLRGLEFCHNHNIIHRDVKPENILVGKTGIVKLCDFGFARTVAAAPGEIYTDYVATRWYRGPELLVGDTGYGKPVDIWAIGCLLVEMFTGEPLFPGDSDIDQLYHITRCLGNLTQKHREIFNKNPLFVGMRLPEVKDVQPLKKKFPKITYQPMDLITSALRLDAAERPTCSQMLNHNFYRKDKFAETFLEELRIKVEQAANENPFPPRRQRSGESYKKQKERKSRKENKDAQQKLADIKENMKQKKTQKLGHSPRKSNNSKSDSNNLILDSEISSRHNQSLQTTQIIKRLSPIHDTSLDKPIEDSVIVSSTQSETRINQRTLLGMNVTVPSADLPELNPQSGLRGSEYKAKKVHGQTRKTQHGEVELQGSPISSQSDWQIDVKGTLKSERKTRQEKEEAHRESRRETEFELPPVAGVAPRTSKASEGKFSSKSGIMLSSSRRGQMPHIAGTEPFSTSTQQNNQVGDQVTQTIETRRNEACRRHGDHGKPNKSVR